MEFKKKLKEKIKYLLTSISMFMLMGMHVFASEPVFVSGTKKLVADATKYGLALVAAVTTILLIISMYQWNIASEEEKPKFKKKSITTVAVGVGILISGGIITWVFSYYQ